VINYKTGGNIRISDETRQRVWDAVEALDYRPSRAARALRTKRSYLIALMVPYIETPFNPLLAATIQREAGRADLGVVIYGSRDDKERETEFVQECIDRGVDGFVTQSFRLSEEDLDRLVRAGIAVVVHGVTPTHPFADSIILDEAQAVQEVVSYLIERGHRRIGCIAGPQDKWPGRLRTKGYLAALRAHGLPVEEDLICTTQSFTRGAGVRCMQRLLALPRAPDALFAANDVLAADALLYALDAGLSVPEDLAIVGFDDTPEALLVRPRLTTVRKDTDLLGSLAVQMLLERIDSEEPIPARTRVLDYEIVYRESA
jgi:LacI family transcriptional regulator